MSMGRKRARTQLVLLEKRARVHERHGQRCLRDATRLQDEAETAFGQAMIYRTQARIVRLMTVPGTPSQPEEIDEGDESGRGTEPRAPAPSPSSASAAVRGSCACPC